MLPPRAIAIPVVAPTLSEALRRVAEAERLGDVIEFRLDYMADFSPADPVYSVRPLVNATTRPIILTYHPAFTRQPEQVPPFEDQVACWRALFSLTNVDRVYFDLDLQLARWFQSSGEPVPWDRVIASYHNFTETPQPLSLVYEQLAATPAAVLKIATHAQVISDNLRLFDVLARAIQDHRPLIALTMGEAGFMSRILSPAWGGLLTFGALTEHEATAPGQLTAEQLIHLFRVRQIDQDVNIAGVIGNAVQHSLSPLLHNTAYQHRSLNWVYLPLQVTDLSAFMRDFVRRSTRRMNWHLRGLSVTIPHKVEAIRFVDALDPVAEQVGALNTLVMDGERIIGYNTDVEGAMRPLRQRIQLRDARVVVLGAGGAARAVCFGLQREGARVTVLARDVTKAADVARQFNASVDTLSALARYPHDVLINTTPVGMQDADPVTPVPTDLLIPGTVVFDLVARRDETPLLEAARAAGCAVIGGVEMLVYQAAQQWELWTNQTAPLEVMFKSVGLH
ncbi:MAG: shikimate dehydrogenase [Acidobacteriota bacterium]|nr:shikimate dehydrogenase [Acidobacteriota bacterium]